MQHLYSTLFCFGEGLRALWEMQENLSDSLYRIL